MSRRSRIGARFVAIALVAGTVAAATTARRCESQQTRTPLLLLEPGLLTTDFVSTSGSTTSATAFNIRFETRIPTGNRWFTPVLGASIAPYGTSATGGRSLNTPLIFVGNVFPLVSPRRTGAWATLDAPLLLYYSYGGGGESNDRLYGRDLFVQLALRIHVGQKLLSDLGPFWSRLDAYAYLEQNLTPNADGTRPHPDRFNPVGLFGVVIPIGATQGARRDR